MTSTVKLTVRQWLDALTGCIDEFAITTLGCENTEILSVQDSLPEGMRGAYLAMLSLDESVQIAVVSSRSGCMQLSASLLGMEPDEVDALTDADVADAMGEVINIIAGMVKVKVSDMVPSLNLGLPLFMDGRIKTMPTQEAGAAEVRLGDIQVQLCVIQQRDPSA
jgi:CheY-specific phosphatase CheX